MRLFPLSTKEAGTLRDLCWMSMKKTTRCKSRNYPCNWELHQITMQAQDRGRLTLLEYQDTIPSQYGLGRMWLIGSVNSVDYAKGLG